MKFRWNSLRGPWAGILPLEAGAHPPRLAVTAHEDESYGWHVSVCVRPLGRELFAGWGYRRTIASPHVHRSPNCDVCESHA